MNGHVEMYGQTDRQTNWQTDIHYLPTPNIAIGTDIKMIKRTTRPPRKKTKLFQ